MNPFIIYFDVLSKSYQSYIINLNIILRYCSTYVKAFEQSLNSSNKYGNEIRHFKNVHLLKPHQYEEFYQNWLQYSDKELNELLTSDEFKTLLSQYINSNIDIHRSLKNVGYPLYFFDSIFDYYIRNTYLISSIQKDFELSPFDIEYINNNIRLIHYHSKKNNDIDIKNNENEKKRDKTSLLIIYAPINRFHIMDINPNKSVVKSLLSKGLDVYLLDWGYPKPKDNNLSLNDYIEYVKEAVQYIQEKNSRDTLKNTKDEIKNENISRVTSIDNTINISSSMNLNDKNERKDNDSRDNTNKISILGYCWGGIIALIFSALYSKNIKNLTLMAVPIDTSKDETILSNWAKVLDTDKLIDEFGHLDGQILDIGFLMRNPIRYTFDKYLTMIKKYGDKEFIDVFSAVEKWLYDTPIIPGKLFKQIINDCYKNNLLIKNSMKVNGNIIDLKNIQAPLLTIVAEKDDLVSAASTLEVNNCVLSKEKKTIQFPGGHVGLCISKTAHEKLWPEVAEWILLK